MARGKGGRRDEGGGAALALWLGRPSALKGRTVRVCHAPLTRDNFRGARRAGRGGDFELRYACLGRARGRRREVARRHSGPAALPRWSAGPSPTSGCLLMCLAKVVAVPCRACHASSRHARARLAPPHSAPSVLRSGKRYAASGGGTIDWQAKLFPTLLPRVLIDKRPPATC